MSINTLHKGDDDDDAAAAAADDDIIIIIKIKYYKGKAVPLQSWTGPEGLEVWGSQISRQSAHEGGKVVSPTHRQPLPPGNIPGTHFC